MSADTDGTFKLIIAPLFITIISFSILIAIALVQEYNVTVVLSGVKSYRELYCIWKQNDGQPKAQNITNLYERRCCGIEYMHDDIVD